MQGDVLSPPPLAVIGLRWLKRGGAEYVGASLAREAQRVLGLENVLITLDHDDLEARDWLPAGSRIYVPDADISRASWHARMALMHAYIARTRPQLVVSCNSALLWDMIQLGGPSLALLTRLYTFIFAFDRDKAGLPFGYAESHLPECLPALTGVLLDNATVKTELEHRHGLSRASLDKLQVVYQPIELPSRRPQARRLGAGERPRVLWASRLTRWKRPELVRAVARLRPDYDFEVFGDFYDAHLYHPRDFQLPNLRYRGWYRTLSDVDHERAHAFLYTSAWDGMPNILLAAGALGLPLVTADIGGIGEVVTGETGWLVADHGEPAAYARALDAVFTDPEAAAQRSDRLFTHLQTHHSQAAYAARLRELALFRRAG